ncbi:MAG: endonuclease [Polyangiaceae bacterium]|nr:endonuclease [Polyangiaceae bacterium]
MAWQSTHEAHAKKRAGLDFEEGGLLLAARRAEAHRHFGYGSFVEYIERLLGYAPRVTHDKLRVAEALEGLPHLARELEVGSLKYSHARELTRVATAETEKVWPEHARGRTAREVEKLVAGRRPGSWPDSPVEPAQQRQVLRFDVSGETLASFREAVAKLQREAGEHLDDDGTLLLLARFVLGGAVDDGRSSYQVSLDVCEDCQRARQLADGELIDVSGAVADMARCDGQRLPSAHVGTAPPKSPTPATQESPTRATQESPTRATQESPTRATRDVPPAVRRGVLRRDHHRCRVPGCTHSRFVDIHHVQAKADGGNHDPGNLVALRGAHHRAIHEGTSMSTVGGGGELVFRHADGTPYGSRPSAASSLVQTRLFQALRNLGFGEGEARRALADARRETEADASLDELLRHCLGATDYPRVSASVVNPLRCRSW